MVGVIGVIGFIVRHATAFPSPNPGAEVLSAEERHDAKMAMHDLWFHL